MITSDSVVLRDDNGRREEIRVADDVVPETEDKDKPKSQSYTRYLEEPIIL